MDILVAVFFVSLICDFPRFPKVLYLESHDWACGMVSRLWGGFLRRIHAERVEMAARNFGGCVAQFSVGVNSDIFHVHPEPWGRWTQFDEYFWDGLKPPPRIPLFFNHDTDWEAYHYIIVVGFLFV